MTKEGEFSGAGVKSMKWLQQLMILSLPSLIVVAPFLERLRELHSPELMVGGMFLVASIMIAVGVFLLVIWPENGCFEGTAANIASFLLACAVFVFFDLSFDGYSFLDNNFSWVNALSRAPKAFFHLAVVIVSVGFLGFLLRQLLPRFLPLLLVFFGVSFLVTILGKPSAPPPNWEQSSSLSADENQVIRIIVILDGMIGVGGVIDSYPGASEFLRDYEDTFKPESLNVYQNAYSQFASTIPSIPTTLSLKEFHGELPKTVKADGRNDLLGNRFFDQEYVQGREVLMFQSGYLNYCAHDAVISCNTLNGHDPYSSYVAPVLDQPNTILSMVALKEVTQNSISLKYPFYAGHRGYLWFSEKFLENSFVPDNAEFNALGAPRFFGEFVEKIDDLREGQTLMGHFIFPHSPFVFDKECRPVSKWPSHPRELSSSQGLFGVALEKSKKDHNQKYFGQSRCALKLVRELLLKIRRNPNSSKIEIVVMGDHGSRISAGKGNEYTEPLDLIANHSTLFATNIPRIEKVKMDDVISIQKLFGLAVGAGDDVTSELAPKVFLQDQKTAGETYVPVEYPTIQSGELTSDKAPVSW